jgi:hypothetical protein
MAPRETSSGTMLPAAKRFPDISSRRAFSRTLSYTCVAIGKSPTQCKYSPYETAAFSEERTSIGMYPLIEDKNVNILFQRWLYLFGVCIQQSPCIHQ